MRYRRRYVLPMMVSRAKANVRWLMTRLHRPPNETAFSDLPPRGSLRRNVMGGVALAALASLAATSPASADQAFTAFAWPVTGAPNPAGNRTAPDRGIDVINVKDWGAKGDGTTNDAPAIQAAVDALAVSGSRGEIYFPPAQIIGGVMKTYAVTGPISLLWLGAGGRIASIVIRGCGEASKILGNVADNYILQKNSTTYTGYEDAGILVIEDISINNTSTTPDSGAIWIGSNVGCQISNCHIGGENGIILQSGGGVFVFTSTVINCVIQGGGKGVSTGTGLAMSQGCTAIACDITGYNVGIKCFGTSNNVIGGRLEVNNTAITTGIDINGGTNGGNSEVCILGPSFESNNTSIDLSGGGTLITIKNCGIGGHDGLGVDGIVLNQSSGTWIHIENVNMASAWSGYGIRAPCNTTFGTSAYRTFVNVRCLNTADTTRSWLISPMPAFGIKCINCNNPDLIFPFIDLPAGGAWARSVGDKYTISDSPTAASGNYAAAVSAGSSTNQVQLAVSATAQCQLGVISDGSTAAEFIGTVGARFTGQMTTSTSMTVTNTIGYIVAGDTVTGGSGANTISVTIVSGPGGDGTYVTSANANATTTAQSCTGASTNLHVVAVLQGSITNGDTISGSGFDGSITALQDSTITGVGSGGGVGDYPISHAATTTPSPSNYSVFTATISNGLGGAGTILNVTAIPNGHITLGSIITGAGITAGTRVLAQLTSASPIAGGLIGTYTVSNSLNISSEAMASNPVILGSGTPGAVLTPAGVQSGTFVASMQVSTHCGATSNPVERTVTSTSAGGSKWNLTAVGGGAATNKFRGPGEIYGTLWVID